jgi:phosphoglycolate phosphatase
MAVIIFDYDGTLHESMVIYAPAVRRALDYVRASGRLCDLEFSDEDMSRWIGFSGMELWDSLLPDADFETKKAFQSMVGEDMIRMMREGSARLYPRVLETLEALCFEGHTLVFLSNCGRAYMDASVSCFDLGRYFSGFYCGEDFGFAPKTAIFESVLAEHPEYAAAKCVVVGDRYKDMELARDHGLPSVGCLYGYGDADELAGATVLCSSSVELLLAIRRIV